MLQFADRMTREDFQGDFIKTMLKAAVASQVISFAGGLPHPISFPVKELAQAAQEVLEKESAAALQYSTTAGYEPLRRFIAKRYERTGAAVTADDILITNGSQQALDMLAAVLLNEGDAVLVENPAYLAALRTFHLYGASVCGVDLNGSGVCTKQLLTALETRHPKFFYAVPNFQNPTGLTYIESVRGETASLMRRFDTLFIEDNPYGELRFSGEELSSFQPLLGEQCVMLGTFSKTVSPGMRIGWICATNRTLRENLLRYKQIVDLHTNIFGQMVLCRYLEQYDLDAHMDKIKKLYHHQAQVMLAAMERHFPQDVSYTRPEGGMFLWVTLPEGMTSVALGKRAAAAGVAIAPGDPFYEAARNVRSFRLNYTNCDDETIEKGIAILGDVMRVLR